MPQPRRVLIVAYYFPPMGYSGVQRVAKFAKYLPAFGWQPTVLTVEPGGYFAFDDSLLDEVLQSGVRIVRTHSLDPTRLFGRRKTVQFDEGVRSKLARMSQYVFVPDNKIGWYIAAVQAGRKILAQGGTDVIFSSAPPYTAHLVGERLSRISGIPLVTDFRDDWVSNPRHDYPTPLHRRLNEMLERRVLRRSRAVTTINEPIAQSLKRRNPGSTVHVITQGFDAEDFENASGPIGDGRMRLHYSGTFYDVQKPDTLFRAVATLLERRADAREHILLTFAGHLPDQFRAMTRTLGIDDCIRYDGYLQHRASVSRLTEADVLWMTIGRRPGADGISTGKVFEYFGARKPILALVPDGTVKELLTDHGAATVCDPDDVHGVSSAVEKLYDQWLGGTLPTANEAFVEHYDRRAIADELAAVLNSSINLPAVRTESLT